MPASKKLQSGRLRFRKVEPCPFLPRFLETHGAAVAGSNTPRRPKCWQPGAITTCKAGQHLKAPCSRLTTVSGRPLVAADSFSTLLLLQSSHGFNQDMSNFRVKEEGLRWDFVVLTSQHSDCLGFPLICSLCAASTKHGRAITWQQWLALSFSVWDLPGLGGCWSTNLQFTPLHPNGSSASTAFSKLRMPVCAFRSPQWTASLLPA